MTPSSPTRWTGRSVAAAAALVLLPAIIHAQSAAPSPGDSNVSALHFRVGVGADLNAKFGNTAHGLTGADWSRRGSRLSARFDVEYFRHDYADSRQVFEACTECFLPRQRQLFGAALDARFDLATGRLRPYVFSGVGLYGSSSDTRLVGVRCDGQMFQCVRVPGEVSNQRAQSMAVGLHSGFGFSVQAGRSQLFTELRFHSLTNSEFDQWHAPVTIGVRF